LSTAPHCHGRPLWGIQGCMCNVWCVMCPTLYGSSAEHGHVWFHTSCATAYVAIKQMLVFVKRKSAIRHYTYCHLDRLIPSFFILHVFLTSCGTLYSYNSLFHPFRLAPIIFYWPSGRMKPAYVCDPYAQQLVFRSYAHVLISSL